MELLTDAQREQLLANGRNRDVDLVPVVRLFNPCGLGTWLFSELDSDGDTLFGLCQIDCPKVGCASLSEIPALRLPCGLRIERDLHFAPEHALSVYAEAARAAGRIVESGPEIEAAARRRKRATPT